MKTILKQTALATAMSVVISTQAFAGVSANIGVASDYIWRGVNQGVIYQNNVLFPPGQDEKGTGPYLSGGVDYNSNNGFYVGTWASKVVNNGDDLEVDVYAGYGGETNAGFGYDLGVVHYHYPGMPSGEEADFTEVYVNGSYEMFDFGLAKTVSADDSAIENDLYAYFTANSNLGPFNLSTTVGNTMSDTNDYAHSNITLAYDIPNKMGELALAIDKSYDSQDSLLLGSRNTDRHLTLSWKKEFGF